MALETAVALPGELVGLSKLNHAKRATGCRSNRSNLPDMTAG